MRIGTILLALLLMPLALHAQTPEDDVMAVVYNLFDGMRTSDSTLVKNQFTENAVMMTAMPNGVNQGNVDGFAAWVGSEKTFIANEQIWDSEVRIDGELATAWTPYAFYASDQFSHCGANSFQFAKTAEGWKITSIIDSRRRDDCDVPAAYQPGGDKHRQ
ncbi:MAG: nuclear transport factor 2 family protein [Rhodothermales bacterium]